MAKGRSQQHKGWKCGYTVAEGLNKTSTPQVPVHVHEAILGITFLGPRQAPGVVIDSPSQQLRPFWVQDPQVSPQNPHCLTFAFGDLLH